MRRLRNVDEELESVQMRCRVFGFLSILAGVLAFGLTGAYWGSGELPMATGVLLVCGNWWMFGLLFGGFLELRRERDVFRRLPLRTTSPEMSRTRE